ncbi:PepSY domain-containing protein [Brevundimonas sp.]|uniref:PepSY-associated TM helix domain-containing protein n=1 Tax=Brevundimonas sp. TaxID=1871086 RepID=UPI002D62CF42|nr:PepSY domain-containing protein [Brevundimonas sp.]HYC68837.1 PepSY domain-containing protein [Brevundimonas sp.]
MASSDIQTEMSEVYRSVWRWHFYAGVLVAPFLMLMALTGALYLFKGEIDGVAYASLSRVEARATSVSPDRWVAAAEAHTGGEVTEIRLPNRPDEAARLGVTQSDGERRTVFVDPQDGRVTGVTGYGGVMETVKRLHSLALVGPWANYLIEIVAGWAIILVATGLFLWWPRGRGLAVLAPKASSPRRRPFWRDLHAVAGFYAAAVVAFLVVTGMPWSAFWGDQFLGYVKAQGLGRPAPPAAEQAFAHAEHGDAPAGVGWTMEGMVMPGHETGSRNLAAVVAAADRAGLQKPYIVSIPATEGTAVTAASEVEQVEDTRILYIDGVTGRVRADIGYAAFGRGAKAFEWGIAVHQGTQYGWLNRYLMLGGCIAIWVLSISGIVMWWKRRPPKLYARRIGAPIAPPGVRARAAVLGIVLPLAILYPMTGLSLVVALLVDRLAQALVQTGRVRGRHVS